MDEKAAVTLRRILISCAWLCVAFYMLVLFRLAVWTPMQGHLQPLILYRYGGRDPTTGAEWQSWGDAVDQTLFQSSGRVLGNAVELFLPGLLAALLVAMSEGLQEGKPLARLSNLKLAIGRLLGVQLPGQRFWFWWCGGISVGGFLYFAAFLAAIASRLEYHLGRWHRELLAIEDSVYLDPKFRAQDVLESVGVYIAFGLYPCFWLLFWPVAHDSFVNRLLGMSWQKLIKYHRWMGHVTCWLMSAHAACFFALFVLWDRDGNLLEQNGDAGLWTNLTSYKDSHPHLAGVIAWLGAMCLQIPAIHFLRRRYFNLFYKLHIVGFVVLVVFATMHFTQCWTWFWPGLMPWAVDLVFRFAQGANLTTITSAHLSDDHAVATVELTLEEGLEVEPLHDYLINVPAISRWEWHPFTCAGKRACAGGNAIIFNIKRYGEFTQALFNLLEQGGGIPVRVQGPIGLRWQEHPWMNYPVLVCIVGGIGISPVLSMLQGLLSDRAEGSRNGGEPAVGPKRVIMVWSSRHQSEFTVLDERVLAAASEKDGWLDVSLHYTGCDIGRVPSMNSCMNVPGVQTTGAAAAGKISRSTSSDGEDNSPRPGRCPLGLDRLEFPRFSPLGFCVARPIQPKFGSICQKITAIVLAHIGGFCCLSVASAYYAEGYAVGLFGKKAPIKQEFYVWINGLCWILACFVGALGLPVFLVHTWSAWRYWQAVRRKQQAAISDGMMSRSVSGASSATDDSDPKTLAVLRRLNSLRKCDVQPTTRYASTLVDGKVGLPESGMLLDIQANRPDIRATLQEAAAEAAEVAPGKDVGVYVAGGAAST